MSGVVGIAQGPEVRARAGAAGLDTKIAAQAADEDRVAHIHSAMSRLAELSGHLESQTKEANCVTKREMIRAVVRRIEIGLTKIAIVLRLPAQTSALGVARR